jgi:hypothetical protein
MRTIRGSLVFLHDDISSSRQTLVATLEWPVRETVNLRLRARKSPRLALLDEDNSRFLKVDVRNYRY